MAQRTPAGQRSTEAGCVECGRVTVRRWRRPGQDPPAPPQPWCAGDIPGEAPPAPAAPPAHWPVPNPPGRAYNPTLQRHAWTKVKEHHRVCGYCLIWVINQTTDQRSWWQKWAWPNGARGTNQADASPRLPRCPGPATKESV